MYLLNDMCEKLYSNSTLGIYARSLTIEDIEEQFSDEGKNARDTYKTSYAIYGEVKPCKNNQYPKIYEEEAGSGINGTIREGGIGQSVSLYNKDNLTTSEDSIGNSSTQLTTTQTYYYFSDTQNSSSYFENETLHEMIFEVGTNTSYWFASRCVTCDPDYAFFGLRMVSINGLSENRMFSSLGMSSGSGCYLRPVVSLKSGLSVDTSTGNGTAGSMYEIVQK
ncbi:MAG: hypothetical protein ACI4UE_06400 [Candidatus Scatovivens sp.]